MAFSRSSVCCFSFLAVTLPHTFSVRTIRVRIRPCSPAVAYHFPFQEALVLPARLHRRVLCSASTRSAAERES